MQAVAPLDAYHGVARGELAAQCGASRLVIVARCSSTMDVAHAQADAGAPHGTVVVAHAQEAGRGRSGKSWASVYGAGVWASVLLRQVAQAPPGVLSLRVGIALASALEAISPVRIGLKWPNDLYAGDGKLAGVLSEARWRGEAMEWVVVGVGVNVLAPAALPPMDGPPLASLGNADAHVAVLSAVARSVRGAAATQGPLTDGEMDAFAVRDIARGRRVTAPVAGTVLGITAGGALRVLADDGEAHEAVSGSLVFAQHLEG